MDSNPDGSPVTPTPRHRQAGIRRNPALRPPELVLGTGSNQHYRFSDFDEGAFSENSGVSADQAKRALRAHLAETERRMAEAGRLGTSLVQQQKDLTEKLREVENLQAESELAPELKKKLADLEKEFDDVARETARAFLPKQRIPSNESTGSPDGRGGRRSLSPVKYESSTSPTKLTVSNRKQRNQATNRVHDIEFAAEISTSLISQVRGLQALLAEREEELRDIKLEVVRHEDNGDNLRERIKELGESEHRFKEENWNLETRIRELEAAQRDAADNEKKVALQLATLLADKTKAQRELDELKGLHSRAVDEHAASVKRHDIELGTANRNVAMIEADKTALQKKIDDLTSQNQELAKAVSIQQRARAVENDAFATASEGEHDTGTDKGTPEHSPPASPVKGTPRHSVLETETLKTSLLHSQRTLQSLRTNLHREKTEKLELRRMLQDARDELERARSDPNPTATTTAPKKTRKDARKDARETHVRLRPSQLGGARTSRTDLFLLATNDPDWEELPGEDSPSSAQPRSSRDTSDQFETANEAQDGADTTEDFHTGNEHLSSGDDTMTETEKDPIRGRILLARPSLNPVKPAAAPADADVDVANQSTASTSDDDEEGDDGLPRTPKASVAGRSSRSVSRIRLRASRTSLVSRRLRHMGSVEETGSPGGVQDSPYSAVGSPATVAQTPSSITSTPRVGGTQQSLFAELGELGEDSDEEVASDGTPIGTPSRSPTRSLGRSPTRSLGRSIIKASSFGGGSESGRSVIHSPLTQFGRSARVVMVDRATLTDTVSIQPWTEEDEKKEALGLGFNMQKASRPTSVASFGVDDIDKTIKAFPLPPTSPLRQADSMASIVVPLAAPEPSTRSVEAGPDATEAMPSLSVSEVFAVPIEPVSEPESPQPSPVLLALSSVQVEHVTPVSSPMPEPVLPPVFVASALQTVDIVPIELPPPVVPVPVAVPVVLPKEEPEPPTFTLSDVQQQVVDPVAERQPESPTFTLSGVEQQVVDPVAELEPEQPAPEPLSVSGFHSQDVVPIAEPEPEVSRDVPVVVPVVVPEPLSLSGVQIQDFEPVAEPEVAPAPLPSFSYSEVQAEHVVPVATPKKPVPAMDFSGVFTQHVEPVILEEPEEEEELPVSTAASMATQTDEWKPESSAAAMGAVGAAVAAAGAFGATSSSSSSIQDDDMVPRTPKRNGFVMPRDVNSVSALDKNSKFSTPNKAVISSALGWNKVDPSTPIIAEDDTRQSPSDSPMPETPLMKRPLQEISVNKAGTRQPPVDIKDVMAATPQSVVHAWPHSRVDSQESATGTIVRGGLDSDEVDAEVDDDTLPPLPANHREVLHAARGPHGSLAVGEAGPSSATATPPSWSVHTPTGTRELPVFAPSNTLTPTPTPRGHHLRADARPLSRVADTISRQTSMSSFASEVDAHFNADDNADVFGSGQSTDPRMIKAITQTMIGEYLWKYTRKAGRSGLSENRHRRYFWIHPYTRMLYWSDHGPTAGNRVEQRAKSVVIEGVRVVTDDNPNPPGLHRKSLVVLSPGRTIKFTCPTGHRHEIWFNALSYLLLRNDEAPDDSGVAGDNENMTREDVDEFNPSFGGAGRAVPPQPRRQGPLSLSSYNSRTTRNESPAFDMSMNIPTLTPTPKTPKKSVRPGNATTPSASAAALSSRKRLSRIGSYWRSSQSLSAQFNSLRGRSVGPSHRHTNVAAAQGSSIYEASEVNDSAEQLRALYEAQDRGADRLENVRACCDGKHDVGELHPHTSRRNRHSHSVFTTPTHSTRSRLV